MRTYPKMKQKLRYMAIALGHANDIAINMDQNIFLPQPKTLLIGLVPVTMTFPEELNLQVYTVFESTNGFFRRLREIRKAHPAKQTLQVILYDVLPSVQNNRVKDFCRRVRALLATTKVTIISVNFRQFKEMERAGSQFRIKAIRVAGHEALPYEIPDLVRR